jgi:cobalt-zinc-cadmium efflux system outer membrane protein
MEKRLIDAEIVSRGTEWKGEKRRRILTTNADMYTRGTGSIRFATLSVVALVILHLPMPANSLMAQESPTANGADKLVQQSSLQKYFDLKEGLTVDALVAYALAHNGELLATRKEIEAARALVKQARLRANPALEMNGSRQIDGKDNTIMVTGMLPLELGGRRAARITVAERELELRESAVADRERMLAAEVRSKFGQSLAEVLRLGIAEELLANSRRGYRLVEARVDEGRSAPLEQNMVLVEVNRLRSIRETNEGKVEIALLELRNVIGMPSDEPLRLRGEFNNLITTLTPIAEANEQALRARPDLEMARAVERLAEARIVEARAAGRPDASINAGYQRMNSSFPVFGINDANQLQPVQDVFNFLTLGVTISLPVRNKNQGAIEAAAADADAAKQRREFTELTIRREVAAAYAQYERAARAMEIYRVGVKEQSSSNLDVIRQTYELGSKTLLDYITEQRRYIELENEYIDALLATYLARIDIARASASPELINK